MSEFKYNTVGLNGHKSAVECIKAFTYEGKDFVITGARDKSLVIYDLAEFSEECVAGMPVKRLHGHSHIVSSVDVSSDGKFAVSCSWDGEVRVWDLVNGVCTKRFAATPKGDLLAVALLKDKVILAGGRSKQLFAFNLEGKLLSTMTDAKDWIQSITVVPGTDSFLVCSWDGVVRYCEYTGKLAVVRNFTGILGFAMTAVPSADGESFFCAGKDGAVIEFQLAGCKEATEARELSRVETNMVVHQIVVGSLGRIFAIGEKGAVSIVDGKATLVTIPNSVGRIVNKETKEIAPIAIKATCGLVSGNSLLVGAFDGKVHSISC